jgi:hypothetical protein
MLITAVFIILLVIIIVLYNFFQLYKKYHSLKIKTNILSHDITSSLVIFNLILESLTELIGPQPQKNEGNVISLEDLPSLIEVLDEAKQSILQSINRWNS